MPRDTALQYDSDDKAYYIVVGDDELGPLTTEEVRRVRDSVSGF